jgi:hypothetical protein
MGRDPGLDWNRFMIMSECWKKRASIMCILGNVIMFLCLFLPLSFVALHDFLYSPRSQSLQSSKDDDRRHVLGKR